MNSFGMVRLHLREHRLVYIAAFFYFLIVGYLGYQTNFPINDDWTYTWSVKTLCQANQLKFLASSATCFVPVVLGGGVCKLFGFSYSVLHLLSTVLAISAAFALYFTLLELRLWKKDAALAFAMFLANPFIVHFCICFMTDLPAITFAAWAAYFIVRALRTASFLDWLGVGFFVALSVATRQTYLLMYPAFLILIAWLFYLRRKDTWYFLLSLVFPLALYFLLDQMLASCSVYAVPFVGYKEMLVQEVKQFVFSPLKAFYNLALLSARMNCYLALFAMPASLAFLFSLIKLPVNKNCSKRKVSLIAVCLLVGILTCLPLFAGIKSGQCMPYYCNIFNPPVIGTASLIGVVPKNWSLSQLKTFTTICSFGVVPSTALVTLNLLMICLLIKSAFRLRQGFSTKTKRASFYLFNTLAIAANGFLTCLLLSLQSLDRYIMVLLLPFIIGCFAFWRYLRLYRYRVFVLIGCLLMFVYALLAANDYISFCSSKYAAINWLEQKNVFAKDIDGGPEYNLLANPALIATYKFTETQHGWDEAARGGEPLCQRRWWPVTSEKYVISVEKMDGSEAGFEIIHAIEYRSILQSKQCYIYVMKKHL
jgi:hypothetical protein